MSNMFYIVRFLSLVAFLGLSHYLYLNGHMILRHVNLVREIIQMTHHALYSHSTDLTKSYFSSPRFKLAPMQTIVV